MELANSVAGKIAILLHRNIILDDILSILALLSIKRQINICTTFLSFSVPDENKHLSGEVFFCTVKPIQ